MNETISHFLQKQTCASICCLDEQNIPYCFSCFYAFDKSVGILYFKSSVTSNHAQLLLQNPVIAGTILPDRLNKLAVVGIQFTGILLNEDHPDVQQASAFYVSKYPISLAIPGRIWAIQINFCKLTDSTKVFGKKLFWKRDGNQKTDSQPQ